MPFTKFEKGSVGDIYLFDNNRRNNVNAMPVAQHISPPHNENTGNTPISTPLCQCRQKGIVAQKV